ncbi:MAG: response regulator [Elusimicrobia bacterium]|nr:response regulator [Elusimicrobiota bacterium]
MIRNVRKDVRTKRVVVVDDDPMVANLVRRLLEGRGYQAEIFHDGRSGIEAVLDSRPDLIVLDVRMPIVHGYDVCRYVKSRGELKHTKVLMLSGLSLTSDMEFARVCGSDDYLTKPFRDAELLEKVEKLIGDGEEPTEEGAVP